MKNENLVPMFNYVRKINKNDQMVSMFKTAPLYNNYPTSLLGIPQYQNFNVDWSNIEDKSIIVDFPYGYPPEQFAYINYSNVKPNKYIISTYGRIFSDSYKEGFKIRREMHPSISQGYKRISLMTNNNTKKRIAIHRLIALTFIQKTKEDIMLGRDVVNHKNLNKLDNYVWNLEWTTNKENIIHAVRNGDYFELPISTKRKICEALEKRFNYYDCCIYANIEPTKNNLKLIGNIRTKFRWSSISDEYDIDTSSFCFDYSLYIEDICKMLEKGYRGREIYDALQLPVPYDNFKTVLSGILNRRTYTQISKNYDFETNKNHYTENNITSNKITIEQVRKICECLEQHKSYSECCIAANIEPSEDNREIIGSVSRHENWNSVSKDYNIQYTSPERVDRSEYVEDICCLLDRGYGNTQIIRELGLDQTTSSMNFISKIKQGKRFKSISSKHKFCQELNGNKKEEEKYVRTICEYLEQGLSAKQIAVKMNIDYDSSLARKVSKIKGRTSHKDISKDYRF